MHPAARFSQSSVGMMPIRWAYDANCNGNVFDMTRTGRLSGLQKPWKSEGSGGMAV